MVWSNQTCGMQKHRLAELCPDGSTPPLLPNPGRAMRLSWGLEQWGDQASSAGQESVAGQEQGTPGDELHKYREVQVSTKSP